MRALTYTTVRQNLAKTIDRVIDDHEPIIVTKKNDRAVVMIALEDYEAMEETAYLLRSPANADRLMRSISQLESGKGIEKKLVE
jgi:antitoxin YefM